LFGQLSREGLSVIPAVGSEDRERVGYEGGYTVITHGSGSGGTVDAIQLELGNELRSDEALPTTASKLTDAITSFAKEYLPANDQRVLVVAKRRQPGRFEAYCDVGAGPSIRIC
jgi:hypothetical protein